MKKNKDDYVLFILNILMNTDEPLSTNQICSRTGCDRKTVYHAMDRLETSGFGVEIEKGKGKQNTYRFVGVYGF